MTYEQNLMETEVLAMELVKNRPRFRCRQSGIMMTIGIIREYGDDREFRYAKMLFGQAWKALDEKKRRVKVYK